MRASHTVSYAAWGALRQREMELVDNMNEPGATSASARRTSLLPERGCESVPAGSVVACDQYTSQPEYWQRVEQTRGPTPPPPCG